MLESINSSSTAECLNHNPRLFQCATRMVSNALEVGVAVTLSLIAPCCSFIPTCVFDVYSSKQLCEWLPASVLVVVARSFLIAFARPHDHPVKELD